MSFGIFKMLSFHSVCRLFPLLIASFAVQKLLVKCELHLSVFAFVTCALGIVSKSHCSFLVFSSSSSAVQGLHLSLNPHELIFAYGTRGGSQVILVLVDTQFSQHHWLKM
jgi:hypothetical protein